MPASNHSPSPSDRPQPPATPADGWDPEDATRDPDRVRVVEDPVAAIMGGAFVLHRDGIHLIVVDPSLHPWLRRVAMAHEMVHVERGIVDCAETPAGWDALVEREEVRVREEVTDRLAPPPAVDAFVAQCLAAGEPVVLDEFAAPFQLPEDVAALALRRAATRRRSRRRDRASARGSR